MKYTLFTIAYLCFSTLSFSQETKDLPSDLEKANLTLHAIYENYGVQGQKLLRENYPYNDKYTAGYLSSEEQAKIPNQYAYLWPYSGTFSAVNALFDASSDTQYVEMLDKQVLPGLEQYFDTKRTPYGYASYINTSKQSDRFYDDNVWLGIDFTDSYTMTGEHKYLAKAQLVWKFVASGIDEKLGGGIYWCEQKKGSKNTCSNAPGAVFALKLFEATRDSSYYFAGKDLYEWTKEKLQDSTDYLYFDNISLNGNIGKAKYAYNSGQMMQAAALLYKLTHDSCYLIEVQTIAKSCYNYFFSDFEGTHGEKFKLLKKGDVWFTAVMFRGFLELYTIDTNRTYIDAFEQSLEYAWKHARNEKGLFSADWSGQTSDKANWLLTQAAMVEMYARLAAIESY